MGAGHSHGHTDHAEPTPQSLAARKRANWLLAAVLIPLTLLTLAAMAMMWPSGNKADLKLSSPYAAALQPYSETAGYINFMDGDDLPRVAENYGPNYGRLREIKGKYDPGNLFHVNQNIKPQ
jgi:hypothetical protein